MTRPFCLALMAILATRLAVLAQQNDPPQELTNSIGMKLTLIPAGEFMMGAPGSDSQKGHNEVPQHRVEITHPFQLGVYPVTQAEYQKVLGTNPSHFKGNDRRPVDRISWFDAVAFCNKLSETESMKPFYRINGMDVSIVGGSGYRLPTEAEREYACRAGTTTKWCSGDDETQLQEYAWFKPNSTGTTALVGGKKANTWGLYDMHGNVWEWCWDRYESDYYKQSPTNDPSGPPKGEARVLRGGSFDLNPSFLRSAYRYDSAPSGRAVTFGFRLARTLAPAPEVGGNEKANK